MLLLKCLCFCSFEIIDVTCIGINMPFIENSKYKLGYCRTNLGHTVLRYSFEKLLYRLISSSCLHEHS